MSRPGKVFTAVIATIAVATVLAGILILVFLGLSGSEREALQSKQAALRDVNMRQGPLATEQTIARWETYRKNLEKLQSDVGRYFETRDRNLEKYFPDFDRRASGDRFRQVYQEKALALYKMAEPVLAKDPNGNPAPAKEVFAFDEWTWMPSPGEVRIAQAKFNIREAVADILIELADKGKEAEGTKRLSPMLLSIRLKNPAEVDETAIVATIPGTVEVLMDARDVPSFLKSMLGPGKHGLLVILRKLSVKKTVNLNLKYPEAVKQGEEPKLKPGQFLKPVEVTLAFDVLDYQAKKGP
jgi:hypothetical protein